MIAALVTLGAVLTMADGADPAAGLTVRTWRATGSASFVTAADGGTLPVRAPESRPQVQAIDVLRQFGHLFGITDPDRQLVPDEVRVDALGHTHSTYRQVHQGLPVFAGLIKVHRTPQGMVRAINGTFIPDIQVNTTPTLSAENAARIAVASVLDQLQRQTNLRTMGNSLMVFRANLPRSVPGPNHLVYQVEVGNGTDVREFVYVDAHKGHVVDQITGIHDAIHRRIFIGDLETLTLFWEEGDFFPTGFGDIDNQIAFAEDTYNLVASATNGSFRSWNGGDAVMDSVLIDPDPFFVCPNAFWNGVFTAFCPGVTGDDTVAHEWGHAYTESTHNLIYQWQPGALNESYSDIYGEVVDLINGDGADAPDLGRSDGRCSTFGYSLSPVLEVHAPPAIARVYGSAGAAFNPAPPVSVTGSVELVNDGNDEGGSGSIRDGCQPFVGFTPGAIALMDRGACEFTIKAVNAEAAGAAAVIIVNTDDFFFTMPGTGPLSIPSVMISNGDGTTIRVEAAAGTANATVALEAATDTESSLRWLSGEDDPSFGGAIRDMWEPTCFGDPGKVTDTGHYFCGTPDAGGVHTNSGVSNHAFALLVDGGAFNGQTISGIGLTKAFHIYRRAQEVYQVPATDFADHADALEQSCADLIGSDLFALNTEAPTGAPSGEIITTANCAELSKVITAVELREEPTHCNFQPLLQPDAPGLCADVGFSDTLFVEDWESGLGGWSVGTRNVFRPSTFSTPDWAVVGDLPADRAGSAAFVPDLVAGDCNADIESGVLYLESPDIVIASGGAPRVAFDHWVATEAGWDGANVKLQVNGGSWSLVPSTSYRFNSHNAVLVPVFEGNTNPMAGEPAFTGTDGGSVEGSWGQSQFDLSGLVAPGDIIRLRFELGVDGCNGVVGWYLDVVRAVLCVSACADGCGIDGECRDDGAVNPVNACEACDATANPSGWSPRPDGTPCGDGPTECTDQATCDGEGSCAANHHASGTPCEADADRCTIDQCDGDGMCLRVDDVDCPAPAPPCEGGEACNPATGACEALADAPAGTSCEADGNLCTNDECDGAGACDTVGSVSCSGSASTCGAGAVCNPATGGCEALPAPAAGTPCDDDNSSCTIDECDGDGACKTVDRVDCQAPNPPCEGGEVCNPSTGDCEVQPDAAAGTSCESDGNLCTIEECDGGGTCAAVGEVACQPPDPPCEGGEVCLPSTGECVAQPDALSGTPCPDDGNKCTRDACNGAGACLHADREDGTRCDDGLFCNGADACAAGECTSTGNPCTVDGLLCDEDADECFCDSETDCDDGLFCTGVESCMERACVSSGNPCAADGLSCNEETAECRCNDDGDCADGIDGNLDRCDVENGVCVHGELLIQGVSSINPGGVEFLSLRVMLDDGTQETVSEPVTWRVVSADAPDTVFFACTISETGILSCPAELLGQAAAEAGTPIDLLIEARVRKPAGDWVTTWPFSVVPRDQEVGQPLTSGTSTTPSTRCGTCGAFGLINPILLLLGFVGLRGYPTNRNAGRRAAEARGSG